MAVITELDKVACNIKLVNGTTATGLVKTVNSRLGTINEATWNATKAYAIVDKLAVCLDKEIHQLQEVKTSIIKEDE